MYPPPPPTHTHTHTHTHTTTTTTTTTKRTCIAWGHWTMQYVAIPSNDSMGLYCTHLELITVISIMTTKSDYFNQKEKLSRYVIMSVQITTACCLPDSYAILIQYPYTIILQMSINDITWPLIWLTGISTHRSAVWSSYCQRKYQSKIHITSGLWWASIGHWRPLKKNKTTQKHESVSVPWRHHVLFVSHNQLGDFIKVMSSV